MHLVNVKRAALLRPLEVVCGIVEGRIRFPHLNITNACASSHAGGTGRSSASNESVDSADGAGISVSTNGDDDDGDGDSDPDSDRRKLARILRPAHSAPAQSATSKRILRMPAVQVRIGLSRSTIYESISKGEFPPSISLGARAVGWLESDIDAWLESRVSASKTASVVGFRPAQIYNARTRSAKLSQE